MKKGLQNKKKFLIFVLLIIVCVSLFILSKYSNFLYSSSDIRESKSLKIEHLAIESVKIRYIGGDKNILDKIFTPDFIKKLDDDEMSFFYKNKVFYDIDRSSLKNQIKLNPKSNTLSVQVYDSSGGYIQVLTLEKSSKGNYLISNVQIDI